MAAPTSETDTSEGPADRGSGSRHDQRELSPSGAASQQDRDSEEGHGQEKVDKPDTER